MATASAGVATAANGHGNGNHEQPDVARATTCGVLPA